MAKSLLAIFLLVAVLVGVGLYRGWFHFSSERKDGDASYTVTVDQDKMKDDEARANKKLQDVEDRVRQKVAPATQP